MSRSDRSCKGNTLRYWCPGTVSGRTFSGKINCCTTPPRSSLSLSFRRTPGTSGGGGSGGGSGRCRWLSGAAGSRWTAGAGGWGRWSLRDAGTSGRSGAGVTSSCCYCAKRGGSGTSGAEGGLTVEVGRTVFSCQRGDGTCSSSSRQGVDGGVSAGADADCHTFPGGRSDRGSLSCQEFSRRVY